MTMPDEVSYERAAGRIGRFVAWIAALGTVTALVAGGWKWGAGFLVGAFISGLNYRWLRRMVDRLGGDHPPKGRGMMAVLRYLLLGAGAYIVLKYSSISLPAVLAGLFVLTAAVMVEVIIEIIYARK